MSSTILQSNDVNTANISFSPVKILDSGGKQSYINYGGSGKKMLLQTASMKLPYGISKFDKQGPVKYHIDLSFGGYEDPANKKVYDFYRAIQMLDEFMIEQGVKNSIQWFKAKMTPEVVRAFYTPLIRVSKDANGNPKPYPPTLKVNLKKMKDSERFDVKCYDSKKQPYAADVPLEDVVVKGGVARVLMECTGVWFAGSKYGLSWKAIQIVVDELPDTIRGCAIADEGEAAPEAVRPARPVAAAVVAKPAPAPVAAPAAGPEIVDDDEVFAEEVTPAAPVAKPAAAAVAPVLDEVGEDVEPIALPKKTIVTKKKIVGAAKK